MKAVSAYLNMGFPGGELLGRFATLRVSGWVSYDDCEKRFDGNELEHLGIMDECFGEFRYFIKN